jgi:hypothetical protein
MNGKGFCSGCRRVGVCLAFLFFVVFLGIFWFDQSNDHLFLTVSETYPASAVCAIIVVAFIIAALRTRVHGDILIVDQKIGQWIDLRIGHDSPLALLRVQYLGGGCG